MELGRKKVERQNGNLRQVQAYNKMLDYVNNRTVDKLRGFARKNKTNIHEKEREFFDAIRLII